MSGWPSNWIHRQLFSLVCWLNWPCWIHDRGSWGEAWSCLTDCSSGGILDFTHPLQFLLNLSFSFWPFLFSLKSRSYLQCFFQMCTASYFSLILCSTVMRLSVIMLDRSVLLLSSSRCEMYRLVTFISSHGRAECSCMLAESWLMAPVLSVC